MLDNRKISEVVLSELPSLVGGVSSVVLGSWALADDMSDIGRFSDEEHPSPIHHWWVGILGILGGIITAGIGLVRIGIKLSELEKE